MREIRRQFLDVLLDPDGCVQEAGGVVFDSPGGRIVDAYATGDVSQSAVRDFYAATLPQLGWRALSVGVYQRENEILKVDFPGGPGAAYPSGINPMR